MRCSVLLIDRKSKHTMSNEENIRGGEEWAAREQTYNDILPELYQRSPKKAAIVELIHFFAEEERKQKQNPYADIRAIVMFDGSSPTVSLDQLLEMAQYSPDDVLMMCPTPHPYITVEWQ